VDGGLDNTGERVTLLDKNNVIVCTVNYEDRDHWPRAADGGAFAGACR
jgi:hypothetical protein